MEQRRDPRLTLPLDAEFIVEGTTRTESGRIQNLSAGGAALLVLEPLPPGTRLASVRFLMPAEDGSPPYLVDTQGTVVRQVGGQAVPRKAAESGSAEAEEAPAEPLSGWLLGIEFGETRHQDRERIRRFVDLRLARRDMPPTPPLGKRRIPFQQVISLRYEDFKAFVQEVSANISETGMFLTTRSPHPPGSAFEFQFTLGEDFPLIEGEAEVVWVRERSQGPDKPAGMGVRFLRLHSDSQPLIRRLVARHQAAGYQPFDLEEEARSSAPQSAPEAPDESPAVFEPPAATAAAPSAPPPTEEPPSAAAALEPAAPTAETRDMLEIEVGILLSLREELEGLLEQSRERLQAVREESNRRVQELEGQLDEERARGEQLTTELDEARRERAESESRLEEAGRTVDAEVAEREAEARRLHQEIESLQQHLERLESEGGELRGQLESAREARTKAEERVQELMRSLEGEGAPQSEIEDGARDEIESLRQQVAGLEAERDRLQAELSEPQAEPSEPQAEPSEPQAVASADAGTRELARRLDEAAIREQDLRSQIERLRSSRAKLEGRLREADLQGPSPAAIGPVIRPARGRLLLRRLGLLAAGAVLGGALVTLWLGHLETRDQANADRIEAAESPPPADAREPELGTGASASAATSDASPEPVTPVAVDLAELPDAAAAEAMVRAWADAWSEQRATDALGLYARDFSPPGGADRRVWESIRRERIEGPEWIRVTLEDIAVEVPAPDRAVVEFEQIYLTPTYGDQVSKRLELVVEDGAWKIAREDVL